MFNRIATAVGEYIVELTGSKFYGSTHYPKKDRGSYVVQRSRAQVNRMSKEEAEKIAAS